MADNRATCTGNQSESCVSSVECGRGPTAQRRGQSLLRRETRAEHVNNKAPRCSTPSRCRREAGRRRAPSNVLCSRRAPAVIAEDAPRCLCPRHRADRSKPDHTTIARPSARTKQAHHNFTVRLPPLLRLGGKRSHSAEALDIRASSKSVKRHLGGLLLPGNVPHKHSTRGRHLCQASATTTRCSLWSGGGDVRCGGASPDRSTCVASLLLGPRRQRTSLCRAMQRLELVAHEASSSAFVQVSPCALRSPFESR